jgi:hypothetical protein
MPTWFTLPNVGLALLALFLFWFIVGIFLEWRLKGKEGVYRFVDEVGALSVRSLGCLFQLFIYSFVVWFIWKMLSKLF